MKKLDVFKTIVLAFLLTTGLALVNAQADSLQAYYDGATLGDAIDLTGNGYNLPTHSTSIDVQLITGTEALGGGSSLDFDGTDGDPAGLLRLNSQNLNITTEFTTMAWIKLNDDAMKGIYAQQNAFGISEGHNDDGTAHFKFAIKDDGGSKYYCDADTIHVAIGEWHHVAAVYDGTDMKLYVDGVEKMSAAQAGKTLGSVGHIAFGYDYVGVGKYFKGALDEVKIFNKALSAEQIAAETIMAIAGADQNTGIGTLVTLDGSASTGSGLSYSWTLNTVTVGSTASISTDTLSTGEHIFVLTVTDGTNSDTDTVKVSVANIAAIAGDDQTVDEGVLVTLDGGASVGTNLTYQWELGGVVVGSVDSISTDTLSIGIHEFILTVDDGTDNATDFVIVTVEAVTVEADAGSHVYAVTDNMATLDASASTGVELTYAWSLNSTSVGSVASISTDTLSIGDHKFALAVTDKHGTEARDTVTVSIQGAKKWLDFETLAIGDTSFIDQESGATYLVFDISNGSDKTNGDRLPDIGATPTLVDGINGMAMEFDGSHDWINLQYAYSRGGFSTPSEDFSISVWFNNKKTSISPPKAPEQVIFDSPGFGLLIENDTLYAAAYFRDRDNGSAPTGGAVVEIPFTSTNEWVNVTMVFDGGAVNEGASSTFAVYLNGSLIKTDTIDVPSYYADWYDWANIGATTGYASLASNGLISNYLQEGNMGVYFDGIIDEFKTTRSVLSPTEIKNECISSKVSYKYNFETQADGDSVILDAGDGAAWDIKLISGGNDDDPVGSATFEEGILTGSKALKFNGSTEWLLVQEKYLGTNPAPGVQPFGVDMTELSLSAWINPVATTVNPPKSPSQVIAKIGYGNGIGLMIKNDTLWAAAGVRDRADSDPKAGTNFGVPFDAAGEWSLVQLSFEGDAANDTSYVKLFVNGVLVGESGLPGSQLYSCFYTNTQIGANMSWGVLTDLIDYTADHILTGFYKGLMDEVIISKKAISADEALAKYNAEKPGVVQDPVADAGDNQSVEVETMVTLDGSGSSDPASLDLTYEWTLEGTVVGSDASISTDTLSIGEHTFVLTVTNTGGKTNSAEVTVTITKKVSVRNYTTAISVYPNPTSGILYMDMSDLETSANVNVLNMLGMVVKSKLIDMPDAKVVLNLNDLNTGLYIIRVESDNKIYTSKVHVTK